MNQVEETFRSINPGKIGSRIALVIVVLILIFGTFGTVGAGERGVLLQFGAVKDKVFGEGLYVKIPLIQSVTKMDVKIQKDEVPATASSKDLQVVTSRIALNYHLDPDSVNRVWQEVGRSYNTRIIAPAIQEAVKATTAKFTAEELITKREEVKEEIKANLAERILERGIVVDEFNIIDFDFSRAFNEAIEQKVTAEQLKLKAERDLERIVIEKEQAITQAEARAQAIQIEAQALRTNPAVTELRWIEKWDGKTPQYWGQASPFIGINR
ncbi:HflC protein [bacterium]|jgi:regulator of protease activity HflC (stomatin/prohibitin superfamily)|nr:HflC protein [bacterium]MDP6571618.1 prohibitin family protein [Patescibacteria group bacterium]|tara:strand:- start:2030 stop:2836 length:807 start_codon:yes stop_codon:yes gene_type:complete